MPDAPHTPPETADRPDTRSALVFDAAFYLAANPDLAVLAEQPGFDAEEHFWSEGIWDGRVPSAFYDIAHLQRVLPGRLSPAEALPRFFALPPGARPVPNGWFDQVFLRRRHGAELPELAGLTDFALFTFYADNAGPLALSPNALFDEAAYQARSPDVAGGVSRGLIASGFRHFVTTGWRERRAAIAGAWAGIEPDAAMKRAERDALLAHAPVPPGLAWWFDEEFYLALHRDVHAMRRAGQVRSGLEHFLAAGFAEGRIPHPALFHAFRDRAPHVGLEDVLRGLAPPGAGAPLSLANAVALRDLVRARGWSGDNREIADLLWELVAPAPIPGRFDEAAYLAANPDVAGMVARGEVADAAAHWRAAGMAEGRLAPYSAIFADRRVSLRAISQGTGEGGNGVNFIAPLSLTGEPGEAARDMLAALDAGGIPIAPVDVSGLLDPQAPVDLVAPETLPHGITLIDLPPERMLALVARFGPALFDRRLMVALFPAVPPDPAWRAVLGGLDLILTGRAATNPLAAITGRTVLPLPRPLDPARLRRLAGTATHPVLARLRAARKAGRQIVLFTLEEGDDPRARGLDLFLTLARHLEREEPGAFLFCVKAATRAATSPGLAAAIADAPVLLVDEPWSAAQMTALRLAADLATFPDRAPGSARAALSSIALGVPTLVALQGEAAALLGPDYPLGIPGQPAETGHGTRPGATWFEPDPALLLARLADHRAAPRRFSPWPRRVARLLAPATIGPALRALLATHCGLEGRIERLGETLDAATPQGFTLGARPPAARLAPAIAGALAPLFTVVTKAGEARPEAVAALHLDLVAQECPAWDWCLLADRPAEPDWLTTLKQADARILAGGPLPDPAIALAAGRFLLFLHPADRIEPGLLAAYADRIAADPDADLIYCDEDAPGIGASFRRPDWSPEHLLSEMYLGRAFCIRKALFLRIGGAQAGIGPAGLHDLVLRAASAGARIVHLPCVLHHAAATEPEPAAAGQAVLAAHLARLGLAGTVVPGLLPGTFRIRPQLPAGRPSAVILSGCARAPGDAGPVLHLERFLRSILDHGLDGDSLKLDIDIVVDRGREPEVAHLAALDPALRIVAYDPLPGGFNFAAKANHAIRAARGETVILLNDDMEALDAGWAEALLEPLALPGVGIVGARLLYPDGTLQHAGIVLGGPGAARHPFVGLAEDAVGANSATHVMRNYAAVTAACMAFRRQVFEQAGGFDERFAVDFNDTDFCLRVLRMGLRIVYTPFARLRHHESQTVIRAHADALELQAFTRRWHALIRRDPYRPEGDAELTIQ